MMATSRSAANCCVACHLRAIPAAHRMSSLTLINLVVSGCPAPNLSLGAKAALVNAAKLTDKLTGTSELDAAPFPMCAGDVIQCVERRLSDLLMGCGDGQLFSQSGTAFVAGITNGRSHRSFQMP